MKRRARLDPWWKDGGDGDRATRLFDALRKVRNRDANRRRRGLYHACMYGDGGLDGLSGAVSAYAPPSLQFNVVRRNVDTTHAKIAKARPLPLALTSGGDFRQRRRAQRLSRFFAGVFDELEVFETSEMVARDALIFGTGISHSFQVDAKLIHERVLFWELDVDARDARYGKPRMVYLHRWIARDVLIEQYPAHADAIEQGSNGGFDDDPLGAGIDDDGDYVVVVEAWKLADAEGNGGRHVISVHAPDGVLLDEEYVRDYAPFETLHFSKPLMGYWGDGFGHILEGLQYELNCVARRVQESQYMMGSYVLCEEGSGIATDTLDNGLLTIVTYRGAPPQWQAPPANNPQTLQYLEQLRGQWAYDETGTSSLSAQSQKPAGLNSGAALRTFSDIESERFVLFGKAYERYHVRIAWQLFDLADEVSELTVRATTRGKKLEALSFADVRLDRKDFTLRVFPTSALSTDPASRRAEVGEYVNTGLIPPEVARGLLELPDLEEYNAIEDAPRQCTEEIIWRILDADLDTDDAEELAEREDAAYVYPEPPFDLRLCVTLAAHHYLRAKLDGAPEENLSLLMRFLVDSQSELAKAAPPAPGAENPVPPMAPDGIAA